MSDKERDELAMELFIVDNHKQSREQSVVDWGWFTTTPKFGVRVENYKTTADGLIAAGYGKHPGTTTEWGVAYPGSNSVDYIGTALYAESAFDEEEDSHENVQLVRREVTAWDVVRTSMVDADGDLEAGGA